MRRKSLFDDKSAEINQLTGSIKQDITSINAELEELEVGRWIWGGEVVEFRSKTEIWISAKQGVRSRSCGGFEGGTHGHDERF